MKTHKEMFEALLAGKELVRTDGSFRKLDENGMLDLGYHVPSLLQEPAEWSIKEPTIRINGIEVPKPLSEAPPLRTQYWTPCITCDGNDLVSANEWDDVPTDRHLLHRGLVHLTEEAATIHARAWLSFTKHKE